MTARHLVFRTDHLIEIVVIGVLLLVAATLFMADAVSIPQSIGFSFTSDDAVYMPNLPDRTGVFQVVTLTSNGAGAPPDFGDNRLFENVPGAPAALAAIYPAGNDGGFEIWAINPESGEGVLAYQVTAEEVAAAQLEAAELGEGVLLAEGMGSMFFVGPNGTCVVRTTFPDGKIIDLPFDCTVTVG